MKAFWVDDSPKITVYMVAADGLSGPACVWINWEDALQEKRDLEEAGEFVTITILEMTQNEYDSLEEFEGY